VSRYGLLPAQLLPVAGWLVGNLGKILVPLLGGEHGCAAYLADGVVGVEVPELDGAAGVCGRENALRTEDCRLDKGVGGHWCLAGLLRLAGIGDVPQCDRAVLAGDGERLPVRAERPLRVLLPPGRVVSAQRPAAMQQWMTIPVTVVDTIFRALADVMPEQVHAGHHADLNIAHVSGIGPDGRFFQDLLNIPGGGWGAGRHADGMCATVCINDGDTHNTPVEANEARLPVLIDTYRLRPDSGGPGPAPGRPRGRDLG